MIVRTLTQRKLMFESDNSIIAYQYSENLQIKVNYDGTYNGYAIKWDAMGNNKRKRIPLEYDTKTQCITLNKECFVDDYLYIACAFIKDGVVINTSPVEYYIPESVNHGLDTVPQVPGLYEEMRKLFEQIYASDYKQPLQDLMTNTKAYLEQLLCDATIDYDTLKQNTDNALDQLRTDYANYINNMTNQYDKDKKVLLEEASKKVQELKNQTNAAIETMIKNANIDLSNLKKSTQAEIDTLYDQAQVQQTQIDTAKQSLDNLQADLIKKRDSGYFDGKDGVTLSGGMLATLGIEGENLVLCYPDGGEPPNMVIEGDNLVWTIE